MQTEPEQWVVDDRGRFIPPADWHRTDSPTLGDLLKQALARQALKETPDAQ